MFIVIDAIMLMIFLFDEVFELFSSSKADVVFCSRPCEKRGVLMEVIISSLFSVFACIFEDRIRDSGLGFEAFVVPFEV